MNHWMAIIHRKPIAALNTLWHHLEGKKADPIAEITVFFDPEHAKEKEWFTTQAGILIAQYQKKKPRLHSHAIGQENIQQFRSLARRELAKTKHKTVIDITCGRKAHSALLLLLGELFMGSVQHVYYNFLYSKDWMHLPYPAIPLREIDVIDLLDN